MEDAMPTVIEIQEPGIREEQKPSTPLGCCEPELSGPPLPVRVLFSDSLLDSAPERARRGLATTFSFIFQCAIVSFMLIIPLMFTEALPTQQFLTFLIAPPPPPPPPPPAASVAKC